MQFITIIAIQFSIILVGILVAIALGIKNKLEIFGISYLLGSGVMTLLFFVLHWKFGLKLDQLNFLLSFLISLVFFFLLIFIFHKQKILKNLFAFNLKRSILKMNSIEKAVFLIIGLLSIYSLFENYFWPVIDWDALAFYDFRAKVMVFNGDMIEGIKLGYFFQYPPYTSFLHVFGYLFGAERIRIAYSFIFISLLVSFYNLIRRKQNKLISLFVTLILASTPMIFTHSTIAYSNLPFTAFFSIGIIYLWSYIDKGILKDLLTGGLMIGFSTWIRSTEPFWIVGLILIFIGILKHKSYIFHSVSLSLFLSFPNKLWRLFLIELNNTSTINIIDTESHTTSAISDFISQGQGILNILIRIFEVLKFLIITLTPDFFLLTMLLIIAIVSNYKNKIIEIISLLLLFSIVFGGTLIFSFTFETWDLIGGSIVRMCMVFIPLILYVIAKDLKYE